MTNSNSAALATKSTTAQVWYSSYRSSPMSSLLYHLLHFLVLVPGSHLVDRILNCIEGHQAYLLPAHLTDSII